MTTLGTARPSDPHWRELYEAAILEIDLKKLPHRIEVAKKAIQDRITELASSGQNGQYEQLMDALNVLDDLLKMSNEGRSEQHISEH
jgi:hypothetical protein